MGILIWLLGFIMSIFLILIIPEYYSNIIWCALAFDVIAFVSQLFLWIDLLKSTGSPKDIFWGSPVMAVSAVYLIIQFVICIVSIMLQDSLSLKTMLIGNFVLMAVAWIIILATINAKDYIGRVDSCQKNHHIKL